MERLQQGLVAAGAALFLVGMTITLGPATGLLDGSSAGPVASDDTTPTPATEQRETAAETPDRTATPDGGEADDGRQPTATDDEPLVDADADLGNDEEEEDVEEEDGKGDEEKGEERDRGNGEKRGHDGDDESSDNFADGLGGVLG